VTARAAGGALLIVARPHPGAAGMWLALRSPGGITGVALDGRPTSLSTGPGRWARVNWSGADSFTLAVRTADPRTVEIAAGELFDRWLAPKPLPLMPTTDQPWDLAGSSLVIGGVTAAASTLTRPAGAS
jgi:hypothetical protein